MAADAAIFKRGAAGAAGCVERLCSLRSGGKGKDSYGLPDRKEPDVTGCPFLFPVVHDEVPDPLPMSPSRWHGAGKLPL